MVYYMYKERLCMAKVIPIRKPIQMRFPEEIVQALKVLAEEQNTTVTRVILKLVIRELKEQKMVQ